MAQTERGLRAVLSHPAVYRLWSHLVGASRLRTSLVRDYLRPRQGDRILDIGCGPGDILDYLPEGLSYHGLDISPGYIAAARRRFGQRAQFTCGAAAHLTADEPASYDLALMVGLLHHLGDAEAEALARTVAAVLKPGGRLVTLDNCFAAGQSRIARFLSRHDRGQHVRDAEGYRGLVARHFARVEVSVRHDMTWVPCSVTALVCTR